MRNAKFVGELLLGPIVVQEPAGIAARRSVALGFEIFYGVSDNTWRFWDTDHAKKVIGYAPLDNGEDFR